MSNVLYVCGVEGCTSRLFQTPRGQKGSKSNLHCRHHPNSFFEQAEDYIGPNFTYVDPEKGRVNVGQTHMQTGGVQNIQTVHKTPPKEQLSEEELVERLRVRYVQLFGEEADKRWGSKRLRGIIKTEEEEREQKVKAEFDAKKQAQGERG